MAQDLRWFDGFEAGRHEVDGIRLFARVGGRADAPPLLMLHGFPQASAAWCSASSIRWRSGVRSAPAR